MKKIYLIILISLASTVTKSQITINKSWDFRFGGNAFDFPTKLLKTLDGGYLLCVNSLSPASFDKSETLRGGLDYWITKTDSIGNKKWDKTFGGSETENLTCAILLPDSGFLIGGYSSSGISGDKTMDNKSPLLPTDDYWAIRLDKNGNIKWQQTFGGEKKDRLNSLLLLPDGSYLLGGYSISDSTGDMSNSSYGDNDYWLIKIDTMGNKLWDKQFGGSQYDALTSVEQTFDGGYIIGGSSSSYKTDEGEIGEKTTNPFGNLDYWIVKLDKTGKIVWQKTYGGIYFDELRSIEQTKDGGYIVGGYSNSPSSEIQQLGIGQKLENNKGIGDFWVLKIDKDGNEQWQKTIGGDQDDQLYVVHQTYDGNFIVGGNSNSQPTDEKSKSNSG